MKYLCLLCTCVALLAADMTQALAKSPEKKPAPKAPATVKPEELKKIEDALPSASPAKAAKTRKILIFDRTEGFVHDSIPCGDQAFALMGEKTGAFTVEVAHDMDVFTPENLAKYDAVLFNNTTQLKFTEPKQREALLSFVQAGKGFIGIHAASDNFPTWPTAVEMIGGQFNGHPWGAGGCGPRETDGWAMKVDDPEHILNKSFGGKGFVLKDEIYQIKGPYSRETHRVLLSLDMSKDRNSLNKPKKADGKPGCGRDDGDNPISWIKSFGPGRVFYCSLGHRKEIYWNKAVLQHYLAGIQWALGDLNADSTPSGKLAAPPQAALSPE
jgi:type 1 glutamine amidotransferase